MPLDLHPFFDPALAAAQAAADAYDLAWQQKLAAEVGVRQDAEKRAAVLQSQLDTLKANPPAAEWPPLWTPGTVLKAGRTYLLPNGPLRLDVNVPAVTLTGGYVEPTAAGPAINILPGGEGCVVRSVTFDATGADGKAKLGIKPCIRTAAKDVHIHGCTADSVDTFIEAMTGTDGLYIVGCRGTEDLRGGFIYLAGAKWVFVYDNDASESQTENLVRSSPDGANVTEHVYIVGNKFSNDANGDPEKACIEVRSGNHFVIEDNELHSLPGHSCVGVGRKAKVGDDQPGSVDVIVRRNVCYEGGINVDGVSADTIVESNEARWASWQINGFITADGRLGKLRSLRVVGNKGFSPVAQKPLFQPLARENIAGLVEQDNTWEVRA